MSALDSVRDAEVALRSAEADEARAVIGYDANKTDKAWANVVAARNAIVRCKDDLRLAKQAAEREEAAAGAAERRKLLAELQRESNTVDGAKARAMPIVIELATHLRAIASLVLRMETIVAEAQGAATRAKYHAQEAGVPTLHNTPPTLPYLRMLVRVAVEGLGVDIAPWALHRKPNWRDPDREMYDAARLELLGNEGPIDAQAEASRDALEPWAQPGGGP